MSLSLQILSLPEGETVARREIVVESFPFVIGRNFDCDLSLPDASATLSRHHLKLEKTGLGGYKLTDLSTNGTLANGVALERTQARDLKDGDLIEIAGFRLLVSIAGPRQDRSNVEPDMTPSEKPGLKLVVPSLDIDDAGTPAPEEYADVSPFGEDLDELEASLLFDPFEDGPGLRDAAEPTVEARATPPLEQDNEAPKEDVQPMHPLGQRRSDFMSLMAPREDLSDAMDRAVERFLDQFDPSELEQEYRSFLGRFARRKRRYWDIFHRQFERRRKSGEYRRMFKALLAEEVRKQ